MTIYRNLGPSFLLVLTDTYPHFLVFFNSFSTHALYRQKKYQKVRQLARCPVRASLRLQSLLLLLLLLRSPRGRHSGGNVKVAYKSWRIPASRSFFVEKSGRVVQYTGRLTRFDHNGKELERKRKKKLLSSSSACWTKKWEELYYCATRAHCWSASRPSASTEVSNFWKHVPGMIQN